MTRHSPDELNPMTPTAWEAVDAVQAVVADRTTPGGAFFNDVAARMTNRTTGGVSRGVNTAIRAGRLHRRQDGLLYLGPRPKS